MTRGSIGEYTEAVRGRYLRASKKEKGTILDEFTKVVGCHRKAAIRLLRRGNHPRAKPRRGRPRRYGPGVVEALRVAWEATDRLCSKRLHPFLPELVQASPALALTRRVLSEAKDSCHVEQKNWSVVRRLVGYDRFSSRAALETLNRSYDLLRLYINFFQPVMKLVSKTRNEAKSLPWSEAKGA